MKRRMQRRVASALVAVIALMACGVSTAQVKPGKGNVRPKPRQSTTRPKPRPKPVPRVRIKPVETVVIRPAPKPKPVEAPSPKVVAALKWQSDELKAVTIASRAAAGLVAPRLGSVRYPANPAPAPKPEPEIIRVQKVTLKVTREDGGALDSRLVRRTGQELEVRYAPGTVELEGPELKKGAPDVKLDVPGDWAFKNPADATLALQNFPGDETRMELPARIETRPREIPAPPPLFNSEQEKISLRGPGRKTGLPSGPSVSAYPTPGAHGLSAITRLVEARRLIDQVVPLPPNATVAQRQKAWLDLDQASRLLTEADSALKMAQNAYNQIRKANPAQDLLKAKYTLKYGNHMAWLSAARLRRAQYLGEAEWWKADCENPVNPDRTAALQSLRGAQAGATQSTELAAQMARYGDVAQQEATLLSRLKAGEFDRRSVPRIQVTHHLVKSVQLLRTVVDLRLPKSELLATDVVTLATDPSQKVAFKLDGPFWRASVPRSRVKKGDALLLHRRTQQSEMEAECRLVDANPYNFDGNVVDRGGMRLIAIRGYQIGDTANNIKLFEELDPTDRTGAKLATARKKAAKDNAISEDGTWRVAADNGPFSYRLRPSPYPGKRESGSFGDKVSGFIKRVQGKDEKSKRLLGPVIVDAIRLEGESAGNVAGVHVGSKLGEVEEALGGPVPPSGAVHFLGGGVEIAMRDGAVSYIEIRRQLDDLVGKKVAGLKPGDVTGVNYDTNRLKVRLGDGFRPLPGTELEVFVAGQELGGGRGDYRAIVLDVTGSEANCKLVRKDRSGKIAEDADWWMLRSLPSSESGVVVVRPAAIL